MLQTSCSATAHQLQWRCKLMVDTLQAIGRRVATQGRKDNNQEMYILINSCYLLNDRYSYYELIIN